MNILVDYSYNPINVDSFQLERLAELVITQEGKPDTTEVSISFVDNQCITELNERFRGIVGPTDVLSFECDNLDDGFGQNAQEDVYQLGDVVIAPDVASIQCKAFGNNIQQEIELLLVHGILHLCGYDHINEEDAIIMESREKELLKMWQERSDA